jgi:hypothetical protein
MKDAIINVLVKGILDSVSLHSHEEETPIDAEQSGPSGINPLSAPEPLSPTNTESTAPVPDYYRNVFLSLLAHCTDEWLVTGKTTPFRPIL